MVCPIRRCKCYCLQMYHCHNLEGCGSDSSRSRSHCWVCARPWRKGTATRRRTDVPADVMLAAQMSLPMSVSMCCCLCGCAARAASGLHLQTATWKHSQTLRWTVLMVRMQLMLLPRMHLLLSRYPRSCVRWTLRCEHDTAVSIRRLPLWITCSPSVR